MAKPTEDERLRAVLSQMTEVPFSKSLEERIIERAKVQIQRSEASRKARHRAQRRWFGRSVATVSGLAAAIAIVAVSWQHFAGVHHAGRSSSQRVEASSAGGSFQQGVGLTKAPIVVDKLWTASADGFPAHSVVFARLTNRGSTEVSSQNAFGVLRFMPQTGSIANWYSLVNEDVMLAPGQSAIWSFHPVGAPNDASGALTEIPQLSFYNSAVVKVTDATTVWKISPLGVAGIQVEPGVRFTVGTQEAQSIHVTAQLTNHKSTPVALDSLLALVWFSNPGQAQTTFANASGVRFIDRISAATTAGSILPGQTITVEFREIASAESNFFSEVPHLVLVNQANVGK